MRVLKALYGVFKVSLNEDLGFKGLGVEGFMV